MRGQEISDAVYYREARKLRKEIVKMVEAEARHAGIRYLQEIFRDNEPSLYRWVEDRDVPTDNNFAERMIRLLAIARKTSFGSQSNREAKTRSILMMVLHTLDLRGADVSTIFKKTLDRIVENPAVDLYDLLFGKKRKRKTDGKNHSIQSNPLHQRGNRLSSGLSPFGRVPNLSWKMEHSSRPCARAMKSSPWSRMVASPSPFTTSRVVLDHQEEVDWSRRIPAAKVVVPALGSATAHVGMGRQALELLAALLAGFFAAVSLRKWRQK